MEKKEKLISLEDAAKIVNPNYKMRSIYASMMKHIEVGNFNAYYPKLAVIDEDGNILQDVGPSPAPFFKPSELHDYVNNKRAANQKNGSSIKIHVSGNGIDKEFKSISDASKALDWPYHIIYNALKDGSPLGGYTFKKK